MPTKTLTPCPIKGKTKLKAYWVWRSMIQRCYDKNCGSYKNYGGRGIKICDRWLVFENFYSDMGDRPKGMTINRIENDGDYSPDNCEWATYAKQNLNYRRNVRLTHNGKTMTVLEWSKATGIDQHTISARVRFYGWSVAEALDTPARGHVWIECFGKRMILKDWEREVKISQQTIKHRLNIGWSVKDALTIRPKRAKNSS